MSEHRAMTGSMLLTTPGPLPVRDPMRPDPPEAIRAWLARSHRSPEQARREWSSEGITVLSCGRGLGAVRIPGALLHAAAGSDDRQTVADMVERDLRGPVIHDQRNVGPTYYALVRWLPDVNWPAPADTPLLGPGVHLGVPDISRLEPPGSYWVRPPLHERDVCRREDVFNLIVRARRILPLSEDEPGSGERRGAR